MEEKEMISKTINIIDFGKPDKARMQEVREQLSNWIGYINITAQTIMDSFKGLTYNQAQRLAHEYNINAGIIRKPAFKLPLYDEDIYFIHLRAEQAS